MQEEDEELWAFGAEAQPGGLAEFNDAMRARTIAPNPAPLSPAKAPLLGLIALAAHWMSKGGGRR
jgi:hypothetical protein